MDSALIIGCCAFGKFTSLVDDIDTFELMPLSEWAFSSGVIESRVSAFLLEESAEEECAIQPRMNIQFAEKKEKNQPQS
ncbi:hypothetical protein WAI453_011289 [Rhynchosporium graminicola]